LIAKLGEQAFEEHWNSGLVLGPDKVVEMALSIK
jgi:hypothetical protein